MRTVFKFIFIFCLACSSSRFQPCYGQYDDYRDIRHRKAEKQREGSKYGYGGLACFAGFFAIGIWLRQRQFKRTNAAGTQEFRSFGSLVGSGFTEGVANFIGIVLFAAGFFLVITALFTCA